jgi:HlyD family secretion protein
MKRIWIVVGVIMLLLGSLGVWYAQSQSSVVQAETQRRAVPVQTGEIIKTVKSTGNLEAKEEIELSFEMNGVVKEVLVKRGQKVKAGQPLARLDTTSLELAVAQAKISLDDAKTELAKLRKNVDPAELASARAALASAQAKYDSLLSGPNEDEITAALAKLREAELALDDAKGAYERVAWIGGYKILDEQKALQEAQIDYETALANYNLAVQGAKDADLKAAEAEIASARATLNNLLKGASDEEIALAESKVKAAQLALDSAVRDLEEATLVAPIDATVTAVNIHRGERTRAGSSGGAAIVLTDLSELHVDVGIDEIDVVSVEPGQAAVVKVDALPNESLAGTVARVAPAPASTGGGVVSYEATVTLNAQHGQARPGMTCNVEIETERREGVLLIPSSFVQVDAATGQTYVEKQGADGQPVRADVTLGDRSGELIEVRNGLQVGDLVLAPVAAPSPQATVQSRPGGMPMPGMMMGPPPGGGPPPGERPSGAGRGNSSQR